MGSLRRPQDRDDFLAAHWLVRICAARLLGTSPDEISIVQRCATCGGPHGRPEIVGHPEVNASLAHSRGAVAAAAAGTVPVGVDVEAALTAGDISPGDLSVALTSAEISAVGANADPRRAVLLAWVRKEACLKAGLVDLDRLAGFDLSWMPLDPPAADLVLRAAPLGRWVIHDWSDARAGAVGAVVAPAGTPVTLTGT